MSVKNDLAAAKISLCGADEEDGIFDAAKKKALESVGGPIKKRNKFPQGIYKVSSGKFKAETKWGGKTRYIGTFGTPKQASAAYMSVKNDLAAAKISLCGADEEDGIFDAAKKKALESKTAFK